MKRLVVDRIRCDGHGQCAELLPELVTLDDWGYPIVRLAPVTPLLEGHARRAVAACPTLALRLEALAAAERPGSARHAGRGARNARRG
jgi:ferredoxin